MRAAIRRDRVPSRLPSWLRGIVSKQRASPRPDQDVDQGEEPGKPRDDARMGAVILRLQALGLAAQSLADMDEPD